MIDDFDPIRKDITSESISRFVSEFLHDCNLQNEDDTMNNVYNSDYTNYENIVLLNDGNSVTTKIDPQRPSIHNHVDGPIILMSNGSERWLTFVERVLLKLGLTTVQKLDKKT